MATDQTSMAAEAIDRLPNRRPASLYDIAVQYAILDWYQTVTSGDLNFDLAPEHLAFMTPMAKSDLYKEEDNALVVYVNLSDPENPRFREDNPVQFENVDESLRYELGHAYPEPKTSSMTDYSVTTHKSASEHHLAGERDDAWGTANVKDRFTQWAQSDAADEVLDRDDVEDTWIIEALQALGEDTERLEALLDRPDFPLDPADEDTEHEVFVTIRVRLPSSDEYLWPGQIPVLNEVMVAQKAERFENVSVEDAGGDGVGYVSGEADRVTGGSVGLLGMYGKKQREHFADLSADGSEAWRARPITHETAASIARATSVFEEFYQGLGENRRLYVLPYLGAHPERLPPEEWDAFASDVFQRLRGASDTAFDATVGKIFYERESEEDDEGESLNLFGEGSPPDPYESVRVATVFLSTGNPNRVFFESTNTDVYRPREVDVAHGDVLRSGPFLDGGVFSALRARSDSPLLDRDAGTGRDVMALFGGYFEWTTAPTRSSEEAEGTPKAGDIDDVRSRRLEQFLTGGTVPIRTLLEEYLHKLVQDQRDLFDEDADVEFPTFAILEQYAQLRALYEIGALSSQSQASTTAGESSPNHHPPIIPAVTSHQQTEFDSRDDRLDEFIEDHEVLGGSDPHQAVFLLGGLVGRITAYQRREGVSSTLVRRYPIDYLTKQSIKEVTNEVLQMNNTYIEADDELPSTYNARYVDRLPDLMLSADPSSWQFPQSELQWLYALGIAYGSNDTQLDAEE